MYDVRHPLPALTLCFDTPGDECFAALIIHSDGLYSALEYFFRYLTVIDGNVIFVSLPLSSGAQRRLSD
jgi:hypothetical protein